MKRFFMFLALVTLLLSTEGTFGQLGTTKDAVVRYRGKDGKIEKLTGPVVDESIEGITIKSGGNKKVAAIDIIDVEYPPPTFEISKELRKARNEEDKKKYDVAADMYAKIKTTEPRLKRHLEYKVASLAALQAASDPNHLKPAIEGLTKFMDKNPDAWQIIAFPKMLVPLQIKANDLDGAEQTLAKLVKTPKLPEDLKQECNIMGVRILMEAKKYPDAEKKIRDLMKEIKDETQLARMRVSLAECMDFAKKTADAKKELKEITKINNPDTKALAYNALGECHLRHKETHDALWNFLYVDMVYNQNKEEHERAMRNLVVVFKELKDEKKSAQYADALKGNKEAPAPKEKDKDSKEK